MGSMTALLLEPDYQGKAVARGCTGKIRYPNGTDATIAANQINRRRGQNSDRVEPYACSFCSGWHTGRSRHNPNFHRRRSSK